MITLEIRDKSNNTKHVPELQYAENLKWSSMWPKGYDLCSFSIAKKYVFGLWDVEGSDTLLVWDGSEIVYDGIIRTITPTQSSATMHMEIEAIGWYYMVGKRHIRARWHDKNVLSRLEFEGGYEQDDEQNSFFTEDDPSNNIFKAHMGTSDYTRTQGEGVFRVYEMPENQYVRQLIFNYKIRTGERMGVSIDTPHFKQVGKTNVHTFLPVGSTIGTLNAVISPGGSTGTFPANTSKFSIAIFAEHNDIYDQNDYGVVSHLALQSHWQTGHRGIATNTYLFNAAQLIEDIVLMVGYPISVDVTFVPVANPATSFEQYIVDDYTPALKLIEDILAVGDTDGTLYGFNVYSRQYSSDNLPQVYVLPWSVSDYEWELEVDDEWIEAINLEKTDDNLVNYGRGKYINERGRAKFRTPTDNATLTDSTSVTKEYQRDYFLDRGERGQTTSVDSAVTRKIAFNKDRRTKGSFQVQGYIRNKYGDYIRVTKIKAGDRLRLTNTGEILFLRMVAVDVESLTATLTPDVPQDNLEMVLAQIDSGQREPL